MTEDLDAFVNRVRRMQSKRAARPGGLASSANISYRRGEGVSFRHDGPDVDDFEALCAAVRPVLSQGERIWLRRIWDLLYMNLEDGPYRAAIVELREDFKAAMRSSTVKLVDASGEVRPDHVLDVYMNGEVFHDDAEKSRRLAELRTRFPAFSDQMAINTVKVALDLAVATADLIVASRLDRALRM